MLGGIALRPHESRRAADGIRLGALSAGKHDGQEGDKVEGVIAKTSLHQWNPHGAA